MIKWIGRHWFFFSLVLLAVSLIIMLSIISNADNITYTNTILDRLQYFTSQGYQGDELFKWVFP